MMIYVKVNENNEVYYIHHMPFDKIHGLHKTREELEQSGYFVDSIPEPQIVEGKIAVLKYNNGELYYEYQDAPSLPSSPEEQLNLVLGSLLLENAQLKVQVEELKMIQGEMLLEIANLKLERGEE